MAAIELNLAYQKRALGSLLILLLAGTLPLRADREADVRAQITYVASALGSGNPSDALSPFDKSYKDYGKLRDYFQALTNGFDVTSEVEILDEQDEEGETKLLVNWTLTLSNSRAATDLTASTSEHRSANINIRLVPQKGKWKIVDFSPIGIFNPAARPSGKS
ncbi:MAG: hypothetical protein JO185_00580 [Acidobacteriaceae bacterium]|nr:hypothetical protein [Acidobacteriaceae bacterium]